MANTQEELLSTVSETVLSTIKEVCSKQKGERPMIGADSVALILKISVSILLPILNHLEETGKIVVHASPTKSNRGLRHPKISLA